MSQALLDELIEFLKIPSISSDGGNASGLREAAQWVAAKIEAAGGTSEIIETKGNPIVTGDLVAGEAGRPTILVYGHYDVQSPGDLDAWKTPPFEPDIRDGRLYARGASDDKGNFLPTLHVACEMASAGELGVNVRFLIEGEEEIGSVHVMEWLKTDKRGADAAIVFDSAMADETTPAITTATRGVVEAQIHVRTAVRDLHSGVYGGSVFNANHVLMKMLEPCLPGPDGLLRDELREGIEEITADSMKGWELLPRGEDFLKRAGARPLDADSGDRFYLQNGGEPSFEVNKFEGGEARTIVPATSFAHVTMRLAPGQSAEKMKSVVERLILDATPQQADVTIDWKMADPSFFDPSSPALQIAAEALEKASGVRPLFVRMGGSIPVLASFAKAGIPTIVGGFALAEDTIHAPNESYRLASLELCEKASRELYIGLAALTT